MPRGFDRTKRVADVIQKALAELIRDELKDPRLQKMITISHVKATPDLSYAKIFITVLEDQTEIEIQSTLKLLNKAKGYLRTKLAQSVELRLIPELQFVYDKRLQSGEKMDHLIQEALKKINLD